MWTPVLEQGRHFSSPKIKILRTENDWRNEFGEPNKIQQTYVSYVGLYELYVDFTEFYYHKCVMSRSSF
jgi:hypothetical protein